MNFISYWFGEWLKENKKPNECITDDSPALVGACVAKFTQYKDVNCYLSSCMDALLTGNCDDLPETFLRLDRSHIIKAIHRNLGKILKNQIGAKDLYARVLGFLCQSNNFHEVEKVVRLMFTILRKKYVDNNVLLAKNELNKIMQTYVVDFCEEDLNDNEDESIELIDFRKKNDSLKNTSNYAWTMRIYYSVDVVGDSEVVSIKNDLYAPKADEYLIYMISRLVLWGNVMCPMYKCPNQTATSSQTESEFKNIKKLLNINSKRVDLFV